LFNLLCLPAMGNFDDAQAFVTISAASEYCRKKRAFFIVDIPPRVQTVDDMLGWSNDYGNALAYTMAVYFPRLVLPDPLNDYRPRNVGPSGTLAGVYARTDTTRGVWKAPAGVDAVLMGVDVAVRLNDDLNGLLNPRGINVLRSFPIYGNIAWGARTLAGADPLSSEYKYINVRRLMSYVEESIFRSMKWAVFEPNNETLWGKIRLQINGFLSSLFAAGAFQGATPATSYFVQCDGKTTTPLDIDLGVVNVLVGIAPVKPAEFIVLQFQQIAGRTA
ncbi:MAG TPA: phage tail sheath C-terminal domain-containing protein, partial [Thermoanaerobaculia bacterium]